MLFLIFFLIHHRVTLSSTEFYFFVCQGEFKKLRETLCPPW